MTSKPKKSPANTVQAADERKNKALNTLSNAVNAAAVIEAYGKSVFGTQPSDLASVHDELQCSIEKMWDGDMKKCEGMLLAQASALQSIFTNLTRRAVNQEGLAQFDTFLRLGLRAQAQAVRTIEALAEMKNPRSVAFVKQANIAQNQQVNNSQSPRTGENEIQPNKQAGVTYELLPDTRTQTLDGRVSPPMEAVGAIDRTEVC